MRRRGLGCGDETAGKRRWQVRAELASQQGRRGRPAPAARIGLGGGGGGGARSEEADRTDRANLGKTWLLSSAPRRVAKKPGKGRGRGGEGAEVSSHLPPPGSALAGARRRSRSAGPVSSAAPFRVTPPAHARPGGTGPSAAHSERGGTVRRRSMRSTRVWGRLPGEPRGLGSPAPFSAAVGRPFRSNISFEALLALY